MWLGIACPVQTRRRFLPCLEVLAHASYTIAVVGDPCPSQFTVRDQSNGRIADFNGDGRPTEVYLALPPGQDLLPDLAIFARVLVSETSRRHQTRTPCFEQTSNGKWWRGGRSYRHPAPLGAWASLARSAPGSRSPSAVRSKQSNGRPSGLATVTAQANRGCTHPWVEPLPVRRFGHGLSKIRVRMREVGAPQCGGRHGPNRS